ncbi:GNAT family N-acetyltransferase [Dyella silvae]|uniref:GNAT family N-acetyltransferase n=1 Tax=Dyella silvae TaxID=2994424 RepID=UPI002264FECB|nr:GNAT family N-acetyltransferase [Dyella silvae]
MSELRFRLAHIDDAPAIAVLARRVVRRWIIPEQPPEGVAVIEAGLVTPVIREKIRTGERFHLAFVDGVLAGIAAVRHDSHVFLLFVGTRHQGRGIASKLWRRLRLDCMRRAGTRIFTLNAARGAIPVYLHLGFVYDRDPARRRGKVVSTPMIYRMDDHA